uniref:Protein kinase domain-containing protein n=1 Tax=viral metagenome TaxID=1070528 RepID=A0A6C0E6K3_9ZZZZ
MAERIGPWIIRRTLYTSSDSRIVLTTDNWVLKVGDFISGELAILKRIIYCGVRRAVETPNDTTADGIGWYAMRLYDDHLGCNNYCRTHWRTFAINILEFLEDLHNIGFVHMDIKKGNILIDYTTNTCVVADYEHAVPPTQKRTDDYPADAAWYYIAMGAEVDKPLFSWRMDLAALAFVISDLSAPVCRPNVFDHRTFELVCYERRKGTFEGASLEDILALRAADIAAAHPDVQEYWRRLDEVSWYASEPPRLFYKEMRDLLSGA